MSLREAIREDLNKNDKNGTRSCRKGGFLKNLVLKSLAKLRAGITWEIGKRSSNGLTDLAQEVSRLNAENINQFHHKV